jgi:hypothetical protein
MFFLGFYGVLSFSVVEFPINAKSQRQKRFFTKTLQTLVGLFTPDNSKSG